MFGCIQGTLKRAEEGHEICQRAKGSAEEPRDRCGGMLDAEVLLRDSCSRWVANLGDPRFGL